VEILFVGSNPKYTVMLRHEAAAADETDASCLRMEEVKKDWNG